MTTVLNVPDMTCAHCESSITKALLDLAGVNKVLVDLAAKTVTVDHESVVSTADMKTAIEEQGFDVV